MRNLIQGSPSDVSVVIPVRDRKIQVQRAITSVIEQQIHAKEIIVIDDGSADGTAQTVRQSFPEVTLHETPARGVSHARNKGVALAGSPWVAFLDSDDVWHKDKLRKQLEAINAAPDVKVFHCDEIWMRHGVRVNPMRKHAKPGGQIYQRCLPLCCMSPSAIIIHQDVFEHVGTFDESMEACEDYDLWLRITAHYPVHYLDEKLLTRYAGHADQLSSRVKAQDRFRLRALDKMLSTYSLGEADRDATLKVFITKCGIYIRGALKRGRVDEANYWRDRLRLYQP